MGDMDHSRRPVPNLVAHLTLVMRLLTATDSSTVDCCRGRQIADESLQLFHRPFAGKLLASCAPRFPRCIDGPFELVARGTASSSYGELRPNIYPPCRTQHGKRPNTTAKLASTRSGVGPISLARRSTSSPTNSEQKHSGRPAWTKSATRLRGYCGVSVRMASTRRLMTGRQGMATARRRNRRY